MATHPKCWEYFDCRETACPVFHTDQRRCWLVSGTRCRETYQVDFIHKIDLCLACEMFKRHMDPDAMADTCRVFARQLEAVKSRLVSETERSGSADLAMATGLSEVIDALDRISSGDPLVRISEDSPVGLIADLKKLVNRTAESIGEIVDLSHEFAIGLAEHFDVLHRVADGDLEARVKGQSSVELLESLKNITNQMIHSVAREIAGRKQAVGELKQSEERFRTFAERAPIGITIMRPDETFEYVNPTFTEMLGYTIADIPDKSTWFHKAYPDPDYRRRVVGQWKTDTVNDLSIGVPRLATYTVHAKDGEQKVISFRTVVLKDGKHFVTYADTTDRARAEAAIRESEERYRILFENIQEGVFIVQDERFILVNDAFTRITGYEASDAVGTPFQNLVHPEDLPMVQERYYRRQAGHAVEREYELRLLHKDGKRSVTVNMSVAIIQYMGGVASIGNIKDITDKKELEARLQRSRKMEAVGTLAGGVAHDLNNILSGVVSYPELLLLDIPADSPLRKPIETIKQSGEKAAAIVQDLLTLARRGVPVTELLNLNRIVLDYLRTPEFENLQTYHTNVQVVTRLAPDLLPIQGSAVHLSKTVMNLVSNAAEAMSEGGTVVITTKNRYVDTTIRGYEEIREGDYVTLSVSDSGVGISGAEMDRIFEPFYTKKVMGRSGTGLGMAVVWGTLKDHGGVIDIQSGRGHGTTFTLYFPVTQHHMLKDQTVSTLDDFMGRGESILVVDDVEIQRDIASGMLKKLGYTVMTAASGEEAATHAQSRHFDLIILDMIMPPGMDGLDTYRQITLMHPHQKAIIASGFSETDRVKQAQNLGAGAYLKKPYLLANLARAVREELDR